MPSLVVAGLLLAAGVHVALSAAGFALATLGAEHGTTGPLAAVFFAPFAVVALLAPLAAGPILRRRSPDAPRGAFARHLATLLAGGLAGLAAVRWMTGGEPLAIGLVPLALVTLYAVAAAWTLDRPVTPPAPSTDPEESCEA